MSGDDRRLAALVAAFAGQRASALAALVGGGSAAAFRDRVACLARWSREARLAELTRTLAATGPSSDRAASTTGAGAAQPPRAKLLRRLALEVELDGMR